MMLTKEKIINSSKIKTYYKKPLNKMKKTLFAIAIVSGLFVAGNTVILSSDVVKTSNLVKEKIEYYNNLNSYNNFYKAMEAVPYTENDFKKDLSLFEYLYVNNNAVSDVVFETEKVGFYNFTEMKLKYSDRQEFFPQFLKETSSMNYSDNNNDYNPYKKIGIYKELLNDKHNIIEGTVISAIALTDEKVKELEEKLSKKYNKNVTLENKVDESILGGVLVRLGNTQIDGSVKTRLDNIKDQLSQVIS